MISIPKCSIENYSSAYAKYADACISAERCPNLYRFYDNMLGKAIIPVSKYNENKVLQDEVYYLLGLKSKNLMTADGKKNYYNWCMELGKYFDEDGAETGEDALIVRLVESDI